MSTLCGALSPPARLPTTTTCRLPGGVCDLDKLPIAPFPDDLQKCFVDSSSAVVDKPAMLV